MSSIPDTGEKHPYASLSDIYPDPVKIFKTVAFSTCSSSNKLLHLSLVWMTIQFCSEVSDSITMVFLYYCNIFTEVLEYYINLRSYNLYHIVHKQCRDVRQS